jgi:hypothetical protein
MLCYGQVRTALALLDRDHTRPNWSPLDHHRRRDHRCHWMRAERVEALRDAPFDKLRAHDDKLRAHDASLSAHLNRRRRCRWSSVGGADRGFCRPPHHSWPRTAPEIGTMLLTSALIPPLAVAHRVRGEIQVRLAGVEPPQLSRTDPEPCSSIGMEP